MSNVLGWVVWLAAILVFMAVLTIWVCIQEWRAWRKDNRK